MTTLVTGSSGFIGSHLVKGLREAGEKVISLIHDEPVWNKWLKESLADTVMVRGDVRNYHLLKRVINQYSVDKVYHLAAQSIVKKAYRDPINVFDINIMGTIKLLEACRQLNVEKTLIQITDKVYGNRMDARVEDKMVPTEPYAASKICADVIAQTYMKTYGMSVLVTRCCNVYGLDYGDRIIPNTIRSCMKGLPPIIYEGDTSKRQFIFIDDVVKTFYELMEKDITGVENIATDDVKSQEEVVLKILEHFPGIKPYYVEKPQFKQIESQSMSYNYPEAHIPFDEGIRLTIDAFRRYRV